MVAAAIAPSRAAVLARLDLPSAAAFPLDRALVGCPHHPSVGGATTPATVELYQQLTFLRMVSTARIRDLNDAFRTALCGHGEVFVTRGIAALPQDEQTEIMVRVHTFDAFTPDNDPHGEHDFGSFEHDGKTIFWKVDCYDRDMNYGSPDPADETVTTRVLTVMLAEEY